MHQTESTAVKVSAHVLRDHRADVWACHLSATTAHDRVLTGSLAFDAAYWSAQAVEAVLQVVQATLEAAYEL
jgi:hypothetical protein